MRLLLLPILSAFLFSQDVTRVSEFKTSTFMGKECDDTEYRNEWGRPNWKNYGQWLSECDSISSVTIDAEFAIKRKEKQEKERLAKEKMNQLKLMQKKITQGDFGICNKCKQTIPFGRLMIQPHSRLCVICAK